MGKITVETCNIEGLKIITPAVFGDERGYFTETYNYQDYQAAGIDMKFVQDNQSGSKKGVLRGLHFQINYPQDKLVRVINGEVFDVAVDLRKGSPTYGQWHGVILSAENKSSFLFRKILPMDFWCCLILRNLRTNVRIFIIPTMREGSFGTIPRSGLNGRSRKAWN